MAVLFSCVRNGLTGMEPGSLIQNGAQEKDSGMQKSIEGHRRSTAQTSQMELRI